MRTRLLTVSAGGHPLFAGVRSLTVTGLIDEPVVTRAEGGVVLRSDDLDMDFDDATVTRSGRTIEVRLGGDAALRPKPPSKRMIEKRPPDREPPP